MAEQFFTREDVEALIPALDEIMGEVIPAYREHGELREALKDDERRVAMTGGAIIDREAWQARAQRIAALGREIEAGLRKIHELGGVPKDLGLGLVDFAHRRMGSVVNLCWKYGEREIRFWHGMDEGYGSRKPL